jgi:glycosyltransferase involved in cell wall biosynthesis
MSDIRFSIVITCHNQRDFIKDAVDSALLQSVDAKEIVVVDDASTDGSLQLLEQYGTAIHLAPVQNNLGTVGARNYGASLAQGDYLVFLDGDDAMMPWALEIYDRIIDAKHPTVVLSRLLFFEGAIPPAPDVPREIEIVDYAAFMEKDRTYRASASTIIVDRKAFHDVNGWSAGLFPIEDVDLVTKLGYSGRAVLVTSPQSIFYRIHATNAIHQVRPFMEPVRRIIRKAKSGQYPGGAARRFEMYAFVGGPVLWWVRRAYRAGLYGEALKLIARGGAMIFSAVTRKCIIAIKGKQPVETIKLIPA